jgi:hypothetical protein
MARELVTIVSTNGYCEGIVGVCLSLEIVESKYPLRVLCMTQEVADTLNASIAQLPCLANNESRVVVEVLGEDELKLSGSAAPTLSDSTALYGGQGVFLDATRRVLFKRGQSFVWIDADLLFVRNADELFEVFDAKQQHDSHLATVHAVPNYRIKKKCFGADNSCKFNAGLMVVVKPSHADYDEIAGRILSYTEHDSASSASSASSAAAADDEEGIAWVRDEEALLNDIYRQRYVALAPMYNGIKRCFKHSPDRWNALVSKLKIIHYVGAKPWHTPQERTMDWDDSSEYQALYDLWTHVRTETITDAQTLQDSIPELRTAVEKEVSVSNC